MQAQSVTTMLTTRFAWQGKGAGQWKCAVASSPDIPPHPQHKRGGGQEQIRTRWEARAERQKVPGHVPKGREPSRAGQMCGMGPLQTRAATLSFKTHAHASHSDATSNMYRNQEHPPKAINVLLRTELPNNSLYTFEGTIVFNDSTDFSDRARSNSIKSKFGVPGVTLKSD
jgi:hypothetical protein